MRKTTVTLADGRLLSYFGAVPVRPADYPDQRDLPRTEALPQVRFSHLLGEWVIIASHRQDRIFRPAEDQCPLCPSTASSLTEVPAPEYDVVVFENRFPALRGAPEPGAGTGTGASAGESGGEDLDAAPGAAARLPILASKPGAGRCEVICFSQQHSTSFAELSLDQAMTVMAAWVDRTAELSRLPGVQQVYCFENRGAEIGATLSHPHGQIYAYPYVTPVTSRMVRAVADYREARGRNLFDDVVAAEREQASRIVVDGAHWTAFVPYAARWPYEVHLYPRLRVPDLTALSSAAKAEFCEVYLDLLGRFDRLFDTPAPYISSWHQAPVRHGRDAFAAHLELFTVRRASGKLKYLAGSESGMGAFANDITPEDAARRLRSLA